VLSHNHILNLLIFNIFSILIFFFLLYIDWMRKRYQLLNVDVDVDVHDPFLKKKLHKVILSRKEVLKYSLIKGKKYNAK